MLGATGLRERTLAVEAQAGAAIRVRSAGRSWHAVLTAPDADHLKLVGERGFVELERER